MSVCILQGGVYFCCPVNGSELHVDRRTVGCGAQTSFVNELIRLLARELSE
jgi:hypothetical protein